MAMSPPGAGAALAEALATDNSRLHGELAVRSAEVEELKALSEWGGGEASRAAGRQ